MAATDGKEMLWIPAELYEGIIIGMENYMPNERIDILTPESMLAIRNARLVSSAWHDVAWKSFAKVVANTPFFATRDSIHDLDEISQTKVAKYLETITICCKMFQTQPTTFQGSPDARNGLSNCLESQRIYRESARRLGRPGPSPLETRCEFEADLLRIFRRFPNLKHILYVRDVEVHMKGWPHPKNQTEIPSGIYNNEGDGWSAQSPLDPHSILENIARALAIANIKLESFSSPFLDGTRPWRNFLTEKIFRYDPADRIAFNGLPITEMDNFPSFGTLHGMLHGLDTFAVNYRFPDDPFEDPYPWNFQQVLCILDKVRKIDLAISDTRHGNGSSRLWKLFLGEPDVAFMTEDEWRRRMMQGVPESWNVEDLRISFHTAQKVNGIDMVAALERMPRLRRLAIGYADLVNGQDWDAVFGLLSEKLDLDHFLLLQPLQDGKPHEPGPRAQMAAEAVKVVQDPDFVGRTGQQKYLCFRNYE
ncbi:uncharacterized protein BDZ99DRAFT_516082 [Mytilinidion resinicola]|uniref:Uncharacterized protein n=1 Tax=Mytilinidion resinicola TaxID=574789 RepID=A0A6A6Z3M5_9PEZI|nr:uncharacterized protein BDZ99DRAFT_516082 [Mytilinidion resinicola]KAF2815349.1 hypothetical protein BDZ99DRAFT_516082 [Mytilinidion resinicola]